MTIKKPDAARHLHLIEQQVDALQDKLQLTVQQSVAVRPFVVVCDSREEAAWKLARQATIGASESAIVLGASPESWSSPLTLWAEKTGRVPRNEWEDNEWMFWGHELENAVISGYGKRAGRTTLPFGLLLRSTRWPWMSATPDALCTDDPERGKMAPKISRTLGHLRAAMKKGSDTDNLTRELMERTVGWWPLQIKTIGFQTVEHWHDGVPLYYRIQCAHEALVWGAKKTTAAALVAGQKLIWDEVGADAEKDLLSRQIVNLTRNFVDDYVKTGVEPAATAHASARQTLAALYPVHREVTVALGHDVLESADTADRLSAEAKALEKQVELHRNLVRQAMKDAERCVLPDGSGFTLRTSVTGSRTLLRKKAKG